MVTSEEGHLAVAIARNILAHALEEAYASDLRTLWKGGTLPAVFGEKRGLFVTLLTYPEKDLRGCIGFPQPTYPLGEGVARAAWLAAREDPRFPPVAPEEVSHILVEVSVLTPLERVSTKDPGALPREIRVGRDGLYIAYAGTSGLLLPEVPVEQGWDSERFLDGICQKAGLPESTWRTKGPSLWRFRTEIFLEDSPGGKVRQRELTPVRA
jgi:uncharacterized protein (TIGR00296 family)